LHTAIAHATYCLHTPPTLEQTHRNTTTKAVIAIGTVPEKCPRTSRRSVGLILTSGLVCTIIFTKNKTPYFFLFFPFFLFLLAPLAPLALFVFTSPHPPTFAIYTASICRLASFFVFITTAHPTSTHPCATTLSWCIHKAALNIPPPHVIFHHGSRFTNQIGPQPQDW